MVGFWVCRSSSRCACRYVPLYATYMLPGVGNENACSQNFSQAEADALVEEFWADAPRLLPMLRSKPHWMQVADIERGIRSCEEGWGISLACHPLAAHMTFASVEAMTKPHPQRGYQRFTARQPQHDNSVAVPYLGHVHRVSLQERTKLLADEAVVSNKHFVATFASTNMQHAQLRKKLAEECGARPVECRLSGFSDFVEVVEAYCASWFCVQPYGDTPTRSALLDCIASGLAVPVVFDEFLYNMLPFADVIDMRSMMVYIPEEVVLQPGANFLDQLRAYSNESRAYMLENLQRFSHAFQWAVQPDHLLVRHDTLSEVHTRDDAFTMSVKAVLRHMCRHRPQHCRKLKRAHARWHSQLTTEVVTRQL